MKENSNKILILFFVWCSVSLQALSVVYFTPRDDIRARLIELIKQERKSINAAVYMFTDKSIAQALIDAYLRGVKVTVVLDHISMSERFGKGLMLQNNGITIFVHQASNYNPFTMPIMHHKFFIFGHNDLYKKSLIWTGSFNCTASAARLHDENVVLSDDVTMITEYQHCFGMLLDRLGAKRDKDFEIKELATSHNL